MTQTEGSGKHTLAVSKDLNFFAYGVFRLENIRICRNKSVKSREENVYMFHFWESWELFDNTSIILKPRLYSISRLTLIKIVNQTIINEYDSHWVPHTSSLGLVNLS